MAISSEELRWTNGLATGLRTDSRAAGQQVARGLSSDLGADAVGLFIFPDGTTVNFDHLFAGLEGNLPSDRFLPIWGGGAGDNLTLVQTYQYCDDEIASDGVAYALLSGETQASWAIGVCYIPIGGERTVTGSQTNWCLRERPSLSSRQTTKVSSTLPLPNMLSASSVSSLLGCTRLRRVASFTCIE
jgi:hypothetical protein